MAGYNGKPERPHWQQNRDDIDAVGTWTAPDGTELDIHAEREKRGNPFWMPPLPSRDSVSPDAASSIASRPQDTMPPPGSHAHHEYLARLQASDPKAYNALSPEIQTGDKAYWEHRTGGGPNAGPNSNMAAQAEDPRHMRNSLEAARKARQAHADVEKADWQKSFKQGLIDDYDLSETEAEAAVIMVSVTPAGTALDIGQGCVKAGAALAKGDYAGALEHLGTAGLSAAKIKKLDTLLRQGGGKLLAKAMPDVTATWMAKSLARQGLVGEVAKDGIGRMLKSGASPAEALTYGVFSAHAKDSLNRAVSGYGQKWSKEAYSLLTDAQKAHVRAFVAKDLVAGGGKYLNEVRKETQSRMVDKVMKEVFPDNKKREE